MGMRRNKALALLAGLALAFGSAAACGGKGNNTGGGGTTETGVVGKAKKEGKLVIGVKADQPGLGLQTGGKYEGFDVEIAKIIAKDLGLSEDKIEWKTTTTPNREPFIQQGTVDLVVATYTINDDRKKKVNFTGPYSLDGKKVCSVTGSTPAKRIQTEHPKAALQLFDSYSKCVEALAQGSVDAVTTDDIILAGYAAQSQFAGKLKVVGKPFSTEPYGIGLKKEDKSSCDKINEILKAAAADGRYKAAWDATLVWILKLTGASTGISLVFGVLLAAMRVSPIPVLRGFGTFWVNTFRNTPLTLVIFFCYFGLFVNLGLSYSDDLVLNNFWLGVTGLSAYTAAFVCEAVRSGVHTVPAGQAEAARAIGLTFSQSLRLVVLPQAIRSVVAPLGSVLIALTKNSTIVGTIGLIEAAAEMKQLINDNGDAVIPIFAVYAGVFVALLVPTGYLFSWLSTRLAVKR